MPDTWTPGGRGRQLMLERCGNCHSFAPVVVGVVTYDTDGLRNQLVKEHLEGYPTTYGVVGTKEEMELVYQYLSKAFPDKIIPELPKAWIERWSYY